MDDLEREVGVFVKLAAGRMMQIENTMRTKANQYRTALVQAYTELNRQYEEAKVKGEDTTNLQRSLNALNMIGQFLSRISTQGDTADPMNANERNAFQYFRGRTPIPTVVSQVQWADMERWFGESGISTYLLSVVEYIDSLNPNA